MNYEKISMKDLYEKTKRIGPGEIVLDVRSAEEFKAAHVPGSINIPHDLVARAVERLKEYKRVYVHCQVGGRAGMAANILAQLGLNNIVCVAGSGMGDWMAAGFPVAHGDK